ncbi:MAG: hypothetical protein J6582_08735, partial [Snodgrassella sp.]|nr:hypothetical protein [Snodgrassella sp.]
THPSNDARITALKKMLPEVLPVYEQARQNNITRQKTNVTERYSGANNVRKNTGKKKNRS